MSLSFGYLPAKGSLPFVGIILDSQDCHLHRITKNESGIEIHRSGYVRIDIFASSNMR